MWEIMTAIESLDGNTGSRSQFLIGQEALLYNQYHQVEQVAVCQQIRGTPSIRGLRTSRNLIIKNHMRFLVKIRVVNNNNPRKLFFRRLYSKSFQPEESFSEVEKEALATLQSLEDESAPQADELLSILSQAFDEGIIPKKLLDFMKNLHPRLATFYLIPKVHKNITDPPGRPIVAEIALSSEVVGVDGNPPLLF
ncbi:uncharacterized protein ACNLHF_025742 [Anomaloglossus baeobatrachus]